MRKLKRSLRQSTVIGLLGGATLLVVMIALVPEHIRDFIDPVSLVVVLGGTLAATLVCRPLRDVQQALLRIPSLLGDNLPGIHREINELLTIAEHYRHGNLRAAEAVLAQVSHPFLKTGIQMVLDRTTMQDLVKVLHWHIDAVRHREGAHSHIFRTMATFAPAFGMLGTLFGLVHMLRGLGDADLGAIGSAMGLALMTTLYGIVAANVFLKPLAMKLDRQTQQLLGQLTVLQEGILMLQERQHPLMMKETLAAFMSQHQHIMESARQSTVLKAA